MASPADSALDFPDEFEDDNKSDGGGQQSTKDREKGVGVCATPGSVARGRQVREDILAVVTLSGKHCNTFRETL